MRRDNPLHRKRRVRAVLAKAGFGIPRRHQADAAEGAQGGQVTDFPTLIRIAPQTALAIAAGLPVVPPAEERPGRPCTGLTEAELLQGYEVNHEQGT